MYVGICSERGTCVEDEQAFDYALERCLSGIKEDLPAEKPKLLTKAQVKTLEACIPKHNQTVDNVCKFFNTKTLEELTIEQFDVLMRKMGEQ